MKTVAIIQARMGSTRLPGKVMNDLRGKTVLQHVIERVQSSGVEVMIATTDKPADDKIAKEAEELGVQYFRGSEDDVLSRYFFAAKQAEADLVVRITSDCPLYDGELLKRMLAYRKDEDYLSNCHERRFPRGLDTEIFTFAALEKAFNEAVEQPQREHVTPYIWQHPEVFKLRDYKRQPNISHMRWTLDTQEDWQMISAVYDALYKGKVFSTVQAVRFLEKHPEIQALNAHIEQKKT